MDSLHFGFTFSEREILFKMSFTLLFADRRFGGSRARHCSSGVRPWNDKRPESSYSVNGEFRLGCFRHGLDSICLAGFLASSRPSAPGIIDDYLIDDVLAFPGSRRTLILLQE